MSGDTKDDLDERIFVAGMDPARLNQASAYDDDDDLAADVVAPPPAKKPKLQAGGSEPSNRRSKDEDGDENMTSSDEEESSEDLLDLLAAGGAAANGRSKSTKSNKPGIRGKRGPEARKRRMLQRMEQRRQEVGEDGEEVGKKFTYDPVIAKHRNSKRLFVTNVSFSTSEEEIKELFEECGEVLEVRMSQDKATEKFSGYCHVGFAELKSARAAIEKFHHHKLDGRYLFVSQCEAKEKKDKIELPFYALPSTLANRVSLVEKHPHFTFPDNVQRQMAELHKQHKYAGKNISCIKTAWELTHNDGEKLDVGEWGFKNFSAAFRTFPYFRMEREAPFLKPQPKISDPTASAGSSSATGKAEADGEAPHAAGSPSQKPIVESSRLVEKEQIKQHKGSLTYVSYLR
ncbi:unnamed protein product [Amoebophrya sp. A120]|nr:unnamed protein product [Amoebophrya sp. A120]|eukprot:GSA120T00011514001.1